jgi:hypothetical protein
MSKVSAEDFFKIIKDLNSSKNEKETNEILSKLKIKKS